MISGAYTSGLGGLSGEDGDVQYKPPSGPGADVLSIFTDDEEIQDVWGKVVEKGVGTGIGMWTTNKKKPPPKKPKKTIFETATSPNVMLLVVAGGLIAYLLLKNKQ